MNAKLVIRAEQMNAFRRRLATGLAGRLTASLALHYPEHTAGMTADSLAQLASTAIATGRMHGIVAEEHLLHFLEFFLHHSPQFGDPIITPWAARILQLPDLTPEEKLTLLDAHELFGEGRRPA